MFSVQKNAWDAKNNFHGVSGMLEITKLFLAISRNS
jgi:hypothetical protein